MPLLSPDASLLQIELTAMQTAAHKATMSPQTGNLLLTPVELVAVACNQRHLQLWSGAA